MNALTVRAIGVANLVFGVLTGVGLLLLDVMAFTFSPGPGVDFLAMMLPLPHAFVLYLVVCGVHALTEPRRDGKARFVKEPVASGWRVRMVRSKRLVSVPAALLFVSCLVVNVGWVAIAIWGSVPPWWASAIQGLPGLLLVGLLWC